VSKVWILYGVTYDRVERTLGVYASHDAVMKAMAECEEELGGDTFVEFYWVDEEVLT